MATWHQIQIDKDPHPKSYDVEVGDLVQCYINFGLSNVGGVQDIVASPSHTMTLIGVSYTSDLSRPGGGQMSAFFFVAGDGLIKVRLIPVVVGEVAKEYEIAFLAPPVEP